MKFQIRSEFIQRITVILLGTLLSLSCMDNPSANYVTNLTENGTGIVRNVPLYDVERTEPELVGDGLDIRWLDCPKYLDDTQSQEVIDAIPNILFNNDTVWPENIPSTYHPAAIMEAGKNPGLGVTDLHEAGITGKGVSIAIIDQVLLTDHVEYKDNLALYEEVHVMPNAHSTLHGAAVSSIAVGKTCGVAPDASLYFWGIHIKKDHENTSTEDDNIAFAEGLAVAMDRMLVVNESLPIEKKIRVVSISRGFSNLSDKGVQTFLKSVERAKAAGIFVLTTSNFQYYDFISEDIDLSGLGKADGEGNPDDLSTYTLGDWQQNEEPGAFLNKLFAPMDGRTAADFTGNNDYAYYVHGGYSWVVPYLAGLYALAVQVKSDLTPEVFWKTALDTANALTVTIDSDTYTYNHVINPLELIDTLSN